jgi:hypothetical protein
LKTALEAGVYLIKPSLREFRDLMGQSLASNAESIAACQSLVESGQVEIVALTLGEQGALLVTHDQVLGAQGRRSIPISARCIRSPSLTMPTSLPLSSTTGTALIRRSKSVCTTL